MKSMALLLAVLAGACGRAAEGASAESRATVIGTAVFEDAVTDADGAVAEPAVPPAQRGAVWLTLSGPADIEDACADASAGTYRAYFSGEADFSSGQVRAPLFPASTPTTSTPGGCAVNRLEVHGINDIILLAEIPATPTSCRELCAGHARHRAYDQCMGTSSDQQGCRSDLEGKLAQTCEDTCANATSIAGYGTVNTSKLPAVDATELQQGALGDVESTIVLDRVVDAANQPIAMP